MIASHQISDFLADASLGLIPYLRTEWTAGVFPTKLFEYLGHRLPVLSTSIPEVERFADPRFVLICNDPLPLEPRQIHADEIDAFVAPHTWRGRMREYAIAISGVAG